MASQRQDPKLRAALAVAVQRIVDELGGQEAAADRLRIKQSAVSDIVNKRRLARLETIVEIRNALGVTMDELLGLPPIGGASASPVALVIALARALNVPPETMMSETPPATTGDHHHQAPDEPRLRSVGQTMAKVRTHGAATTATKRKPQR